MNAKEISKPPMIKKSNALHCTSSDMTMETKGINKGHNDHIKILNLPLAKINKLFR